VVDPGSAAEPPQPGVLSGVGRRRAPEDGHVWRRAKLYRPELPLILPEQLYDTASQLAADVRALADAGPVQASDLALAVADRFSALQEGITSAQAITCGPSVPKVGDDRLWESLRGPLRRTGTQLTGAGTHLVTTAD